MKTPNINFFIDYPLRWNKTELKLFKDKVKYLAKEIFSLENELCHTLNLNLTDDKNIKKLNKKYLNHNYETDVLTFRYDDDIIEADVVISIDTIKENSVRYRTDFFIELYRVIIHGFLHLCGYDDKTKNQKSLMKRKENQYLKLLNNLSDVSRKST
ncbi:MAG: rRNA maturation RNase YbeY [Ignavibacteria bacterium]|nr:rRNA maturation RNase YbeY [Ignavibacteria bacterium]